MSYEHHTNDTTEQTSLETLCRQVEQESAQIPPAPWFAWLDPDGYWLVNERQAGPLGSATFEATDNDKESEAVVTFIATTRTFAPKAARALRELKRELQPLVAKVKQHERQHPEFTVAIPLKMCRKVASILAEFGQPKENA